MLMLHTGAQAVEYDGLRQLPMPEATDTHVPIPHYSVVDMVKYSLGFFGHEIVEENYGVTPDGARFFGVLSLRSEYGDYTDTVGLRNSHDKRFPIGISFGSRVFVCDNLAFNGDHVIKRKHTANAKRDLPGLVAEVVEPLRDQRVAQAVMFDTYRHTGFLEHQVDMAIMQLYRRGVINVTRIAEVLDAYETPPYDWGDKTAWRFFNAATFSLTGRVAEDPSITGRLHQVINVFCEPVDTRQLALPALN
jgi:hypothetical protein